jgi:FkbM family methyltransferase
MRPYVNNFATRLVFKKLLPYMPREIIQSFIGFDSLSPIEQFSVKGYNRYLYDNLQIRSNQTVIVLGGYLGISISEWRKRFSCFVLSFEPIPEYANTLRIKFKGDKKVSIHEFAVIGEDCLIELGIDGEETGINSKSSINLKVEARDISRVIGEFGNNVRVLEMNIEGAEYDCLERLIQTKQICSVETVLIQFHHFGLEEELRRAKIRHDLNRTHFCVYDFPWVWERWDIREK